VGKRLGGELPVTGRRAAAREPDGARPVWRSSAARKPCRGFFLVCSAVAPRSRGVAWGRCLPGRRDVASPVGRNWIRPLLSSPRGALSRR
jgi:hypothetical protein